MIVAENDSRIETDTVTIPGASGELPVYVAKPAGGTGVPGILVIHENKGVTSHIRDVVRRAAVEGFVAVAPDFLAQVGGTPDDESEGPEMTKRLDMGETKADALAALAYLKGRDDGSGKIGCVGFCWGGALANQVAVNAPDLNAGVVFYGRAPADGDVPRIKARLLLHYGSLDQNINPGVPGYEAALKAAGTDYQLHMYEGGQHAFHNDTNAERYHEENARLAWRRTIDFLHANLAG
ncbi:MAG: dienelactone hydrolase family protein [Proteobacteria bacterium]|nr:dienelactone hydrolase family protein [Pseudomonadota bacterium]